MTHEDITPPPSAAPANHGRTRSAWVLTATVIIGAVITGVGMVAENQGLTVAGIVVIVGGAIASWILRERGHGQPVAARPENWYEE